MNHNTENTPVPTSAPLVGPLRIERCQTGFIITSHFTEFRWAFEHAHKVGDFIESWANGEITK